MFISSVIGGMEKYRDAVEGAARTLRQEVIRAEDFPASPSTPQQACLRGVREADVTILILGSRYGDPQSSGLSPTHEEYREARNRCPVIVLVEDGVEPEAQQAAFIQEVRDWSQGHYTASFRDVDEIRAAATLGLHDLALAQATGPVDSEEMLVRAHALMNDTHQSHEVQLVLAITGGPAQQILRPIEIEAPELSDEIQKEALFGPHRVLDRAEGTEARIVQHGLLLEQRSASVYLDPQGSVRIVMSPQGIDGAGFNLAVIEEDVCEQLERGLRFIAALLDTVDGSHRLTHVAVAVALIGGDYLGWQTRDESARSPNSVSVAVGGGGSEPVSLVPPHLPRPAIGLNTREIAEDLTVSLRRARGR